MATWIGGYEHTQGSLSASWNIIHNLGTIAPVVDVWVSTGSPLTFTKIIPAVITATDSNTVVITFSVAQIGRAFIA